METACWRDQWNKLPTLAGDGYELATKTLGMTGKQIYYVETWHCGAPCNVSGKLGHQDGVR